VVGETKKAEYNKTKDRGDEADQDRGNQRKVGETKVEYNKKTGETKQGRPQQRSRSRHHARPTRQETQDANKAEEANKQSIAAKTREINT
jgi:hypothetical protein